MYMCISMLTSVSITDPMYLKWSTLLSYSPFNNTVNKIMLRTLEEIHPMTQAGFRNRFSTVDHTHIANQLNAIAIGTVLYYVSMLSNTRTGNTVWTTAMLDSIQDFGVQLIHISIRKGIYINTASAFQERRIPFGRILYRFILI